MQFTFKLSFLSLAAIGLLSGCGFHKEFRQTEASIGAAANTADRTRDIALNNSSNGAVTTVGRPRLAGELFTIYKEELPPVFSKRLQYRSHGSESLSEILQAVTQMTGLGVRASEVTSVSEAASPATRPGSGTDSLATKPITISYSGTVQGFFDEIAAQQDISWRFNAKSGHVELFRYETRAISLSLAPGQKSVDASISLAGAGGGSGPASGNVSVSHSVVVDPWTSVMSGVRTILGVETSGATSSAAAPAGKGAGALVVNGKYGFAAATPELGIVTVTGRPAVVGRVASYLESVNRRFGQNVLIDVRVFNVTMNSGAQAGVNFSFLKEALGKYNLSVVSSDLIRPDSGIPTQLTLNAQNSTGTSLSTTVVEALQQAGKVSLVTQGQVVAVNGRPSPFQQARELTYIASSTTSVVPNVGLTTTIQPASKVIGFTANFLPLILGDNRIFLQYQINTSALLALRQIGSGNNISQLPEISSQSLQQEAYLKDGQALMLFAFDQQRQSDTDANGVVSLSRNAVSDRSMNVVLIQVNTGAKHGDI